MNASPESVSVEYPGLSPRAVADARRIQAELVVRAGGRRLWGWWAFYALLAAVIALVTAMTLTGRVGTGWLPATLTGALTLIMVYFVYVAKANRQLAELADGPVTTSVGADGLFSADRVSEARFIWDGIDGVYRTEHHLVFIIKTIQFVAVPLEAFESEHHERAFCAAIEPYKPVEAMTRAAIKAHRKQAFRGTRRIGWIGLGVLVLALAAWFTAPWRDQAQLPGGDGMAYLEVITGDGPDRPDLPLVIGLHGWGATPELMAPLFSLHLEMPARVILPAAPHRWLIGYSWDDWDEESEDWDAFARQYREQAVRVAALSAYLQQRYPQAGRPLLTGFSQGGTLTYAAAVFHGDRFAGFMPIAGSMAEDLPPDIQAHAVPIRAIHGAADEVLPAEWAEHAAASLQKAGFDARLELFPDLGHRMNNEAREYWAHELVHLLGQDHH